MGKFKETKSKKPCMGCPFKRVNTNEKPNPGGSHPFVYLGQTRGPFWLPCHQDKNYKGKGSEIETVSQCRGAAIFRSNIGRSELMPEELLRLEKDKENVFADEVEFLEHYLNIPKAVAETNTSEQYLDMMMEHEMKRPSKTRREI